MLASAGDDGNTLLWVPSENQSHTPAFGEDAVEDKESWRIKHMCRSSGSEIYDLAWSPDGVFIMTGSMDNVARIYNAQTGILQVACLIYILSLIRKLQVKWCGRLRSTTTMFKE